MFIPGRGVVVFCLSNPAQPYLACLHVIGPPPLSGTEVEEVEVLCSLRLGCPQQAQTPAQVATNLFRAFVFPFACIACIGNYLSKGTLLAFA